MARVLAEICRIGGPPSGFTTDNGSYEPTSTTINSLRPSEEGVADIANAIGRLESAGYLVPIPYKIVVQGLRRCTAPLPRPTRPSKF